MHILLEGFVVVLYMVLVVDSFSEHIYLSLANVHLKGVVVAIIHYTILIN